MYEETFENPRFSVGDRVRVIKARGCSFGYIKNMDEYINREVVITNMDWSEYRDCYRYRIDDELCFVWDADCLEKIENTNENFNVDNSVIDEFLSSFIK